MKIFFGMAESGTSTHDAEIPIVSGAGRGRQAKLEIPNPLEASRWPPSAFVMSQPRAKPCLLYQADRPDSICSIRFRIQPSNPFLLFHIQLRVEMRGSPLRSNTKLGRSSRIECWKGEELPERLRDCACLITFNH